MLLRRQHEKGIRLVANKSGLLGDDFRRRKNRRYSYLRFRRSGGPVPAGGRWAPNPTAISLSALDICCSLIECWRSMQSIQFTVTMLLLIKANIRQQVKAAMTFPALISLVALLRLQAVVGPDLTGNGSWLPWWWQRQLSRHLPILKPLRPCTLRPASEHQWRLRPPVCSGVPWPAVEWCDPGYGRERNGASLSSAFYTS